MFFYVTEITDDELEYMAMQPVNSPHKVPVTRKMFPFDDVIMIDLQLLNSSISNSMKAGEIS